MVSGTVVTAFDNICKTVHHVAVCIFQLHSCRTFRINVQAENGNRDRETGHERFWKNHLKHRNSGAYDHVNEDACSFITGDKMPAAKKQNNRSKSVNCHHNIAGIGWDSH